MVPIEYSEEGEGKQYCGKIYTNMKCIVISIILAMLYWFLPKKNKWALIAILYLTYLAIAWYDEFLCSKPLGPTYLKFFYNWAKPKNSYQSKMYSNMCPELNNRIMIIDIILLIIIIMCLPKFLSWDPRI